MNHESDDQERLPQPLVLHVSPRLPQIHDIHDLLIYVHVELHIRSAVVHVGVPPPPQPHPPPPDCATTQAEPFQLYPALQLFDVTSDHVAASVPFVQANVCEYTTFPLVIPLLSVGVDVCA